jgi:hypothetical protein
MKKGILGCALFGALFCLAGALRAQDGPAVEVFCNPAQRADCVDDVLEVVFPPAGSEPDDGTVTNSVFKYQTFVAGTKINARMIIDTKSVGDPAVVGDGIQGWSYGVAHNTDILSIDDVTSGGTRIDPFHPRTLEKGGFEVTAIAAGRKGFLQAMVLSLRFPREMPPGRTPVCNMIYTLNADAGTAPGTLIEIKDNAVMPEGSPPVGINITINGMAFLPKNLIQGRIVRESGKVPREICDNGIDDNGNGLIDCADPECAGDPACAREICDNGIDDNGNGLIDCADPQCQDDPACRPGPCPDWAFYFGPAATAADHVAGANDFVISGRNRLAALAFSLGARRSTAAGVTTYEFSGNLGTDNERLIELLISDENGASQTPVTPNKATSTQDPANLTLSHGAAIAAFTPGDFFHFDTMPGVGGPGFFLGYLSDLDGDANKIPATPAGEACALNELVKVRFGAPKGRPFQRGDADGNGRINITDAVLIIQIAIGNLNERYDCDDARDANDDGRVNIMDALPVLAWIFQRGPRLPAPFLACGLDPTDGDGVSCTVAHPLCN